MNNNKKIPAAVGAANRGRQGEVIKMSLSNFITRCRESKAYFRGLVVRAIEDAIVLFGMGVGIWAIMALASAALRMLGVA